MNKFKKLFVFLLLSLVFSFAMVNAETEFNVSDLESENISTNSNIEEDLKSSHKVLGISDALISAHDYVGSNIPDDMESKNMTAYIYAYIKPAFGSGVKTDNSLPDPFKKYHTNGSTGTQTFYVGAWKEGTGVYHATSIYCTGYTVPLKGNDSLPNKNNNEDVIGWNGQPFTPETKLNITYALIFGYNSDISTSTQMQDAAIIIRNGKSDITGATHEGHWVHAHVVDTFATQVACWLASSGQIDTEYTDAIMRHFFTIDGTLHEWAYSYCVGIVENVKRASKTPTYSNKNQSQAPVYELEWSAANSRFEKVLTDENGINSADRMRLEHDLTGTGLSIDYDPNGDTITIWSKTAVGTPQNPVTCSVKKIINENMGVAGFWQSNTENNGKPNQPMTRLLNKPREPETSYYKAYTKGFKVRVHKTLQSTTGNLGDATPRNAVYGIYSDSACMNEVARITVGDDGYSNKTDYINYQTYYAKEISSSDSTRLDEKVYTIDPATAATDADGDFGLTLEVSDWVNESTIKIVKTLGATGYDPEIPLEGVIFKVTLNRDPNQVYYTTKTDANGICTVDNVPFGVYTVSEHERPASALKVNDFTINVTEHGKTYESKQVDPSKEMQIEINKKLIDIAVGRTDASVEGAYFTIYTDAQCKNPYVDKDGNTVVVGPTNKSGYVKSKTMRTGNYYAKETTFPKGIDPNAVIRGDTVTYKDKVYEFLADNTMQENALQIVSKRVYNKPITGEVVVRKMDKNNNPTQGSPAEGALLRLTLASTVGTGEDGLGVHYDARVQRDGRAKFVFEEMEYLGYDPNILYGKYILSEVEPSSNGQHYFYFIENESINVDIQNETEYRIVIDYHVPFYPEIAKKDADTDKVVQLSGFKFKIYRLASETLKEGWVEQYDADADKMIDVFSTDENGKIMTPEPLEEGEYIVYEVDSPKGYYIDPKVRVPANEAEIKNKTTGVYKKIDKVATGISESSDPNAQPKAVTYEIEVENKPLVGKIEILKKGLMFTEVSESDTDFGTLHKAQYMEQGLEGVVYDIYTAEDIKYPDETGNYYPAGAKVGSITTGKDGIGLSEELYVGKYELVEVSAPAGVIVSKERIPVEVVNEDKYNRVSINHYDLTNDSQKLQIQITKEFEESPYNTDNDNERKATFGVFAKNEISNYNNTASIPADGLVALVEFDGNGQKCDEMNLPAGTYYVQEVEVSEGYEISKEVKEVTLVPDTTSTPVLTFDGGKFINKPILRTLYLLKFSATSFANADKIGLTGTALNEELVNTEIDKFVSDINSLTIDEVKAKVAENEWLIVGGAEFTIYLDKECTTPLRYDDTNEPVVIKSSDLSDGFYEKEDLPLGTYYVKETKTPVYVDGDTKLPYKTETEPVKIELKEEENLAGNIALRALWNESAAGIMMYKTDAFTSDPIPNCTFEVLNADKKVIYHATTDKNGEAGIPMDLIHQGQTYHFHEIDAPDLYKEKGEVLNTELHEFKADYKIVDGKVVFDKVLEIENSRYVRDVLVKKADEETGEPLAGCKFTIVALKDNEEYVNEKGETVYLVRDAVTDENGEYYIKDVPAGSYRFIEVEAPEGYKLSEQKLEGLEFTINRDTPPVLVFEVTNTGDIAVYALCALAVISVLGIVFVVSRKRRLVK